MNSKNNRNIKIKMSHNKHKKCYEYHRLHFDVCRFDDYKKSPNVR